MSRERDAGRKWESGALKAKKKKRLEEELQKTKPLTSYFSVEQSDNAEVSLNIGEAIMDVCVEQTQSHSPSSFTDNANIESEAQLVSSLAGSNPDLEVSQYLPDDPALWPDNMTDSDRVELVKKGPQQIKGDEFPTNIKGRKFTVINYYRKLSNGEKVLRSWLVYSARNDSLYCFCCKLFSIRQIKLTTEGFFDWKNINQALKEHDLASDHINCMEKWKTLSVSLKQSATLDDCSQRLIENERKHWRAVLKRLLAIVQSLAERTLALRGHHEKLFEPHNGNFLAEIELIAKFDPVMSEHLRRIRNKEIFNTYLGKDIQNEMIELMADAVLKQIISDVKTAKYYSVIMDCTPDISHKEQLSILLRCVRVINNKAHINEYFFGFLQIKDSTGAGLTDVFVDYLNVIGIELKDCRGQSYDNGANMRGKYKGVQALILKKNPRAFFVPCANHSLNLMICDSAKSSTAAITFFGTVQRIFTFFAASTARWNILLNNCKLTLKPLSDTRWESRIDSTKVLKENLSEVHTALLEITESSNDGAAVSEAQSLANELSSFPFILSLTIWHEILVEINKVSKQMQNPAMVVSEVLKLICATELFLLQLRSNESFDELNLVAMKMAEKFDTQSIFPEKRIRRKGRKFDYKPTDEPLSGKEKFKIEFFHVLIDVASNSLKERFEMLNEFCKIFGFLCSTDQLRNLEEEDLKKYCINLQNALLDPETNDFDVEALELLSEIKTLLRMLPINSLKAIDLLQYLVTNSFDEIFPNLVVALRILLTLPVSVASAERSFSKLKLIKTYLRSTMSQERLSGLAIISIEHEVSRSLDYMKIIDDFASKKVRKVSF